MTAIVFHGFHMVDVWRTDNREAIDRYNPATRTAILKDGTCVKIFVVERLSDVDRMRGIDWNTIYLWHEVGYLYGDRITKEVRYDTLKMIWDLENTVA